LKYIFKKSFFVTFIYSNISITYVKMKRLYIIFKSLNLMTIFLLFLMMHCLISLNSKIWIFFFLKFKFVMHLIKKLILKELFLYSFKCLIRNPLKKIATIMITFLVYLNLKIPCQGYLKCHNSRRCDFICFFDEGYNF
jgi:hypothetical protein